MCQEYVNRSFCCFSFCSHSYASFAVQRVQAPRQLDGMLPVLHFEASAAGLDVIAPHVRPLEPKQESADAALLGLFSLGRALLRLHSSFRLSHCNLSPSSIFRHATTGTWYLAEELVGNFDQTHFNLLCSISPLLDPEYLAPEFTDPQHTPTPENYPIHARDTYAYATLVKNFVALHRLSCPATTRAILQEMLAQDYKKRPTLDKILKDAFFTSNAAVKIISRLIDLRHGLLQPPQVNQLFTDLSTLLPQILADSTIAQVVLEHLTKYSVVVHPAAMNSKFLHELFTMHLPGKRKGQGAAFTGLAPSIPYRAVILPFLEECWKMDRSGLAIVLLRTLGRYIHRMSPNFVRDVVVKEMISMNILRESGLAEAFVVACPIVLKHQLNKNFDVAPLFRHMVHQIAPVLVGNDVLRIKALTCLLVHPKIPILLLKEYFAKGLTDTNPAVRLEVVKAIKKYGVHYADNSGPMSPKCLADAIIGSLLLSMVDVDAKVRQKSRESVRKLIFVLERKEDQIISTASKKPQSSTPQHSKSLTSSEQASGKASGGKKKISPRTAPNTAEKVSTPSHKNLESNSRAQEEMDDDWGEDFDSQTPEPLHPHYRTGTQHTPSKHASHEHDSINATPSSQSTASAQHTPASDNAAGWGSWDAWEDDEADENDLYANQMVDEPNKAQASSSYETSSKTEFQDLDDRRGDSDRPILSPSSSQKSFQPHSGSVEGSRKAHEEVKEIILSVASSAVDSSTVSHAITDSAVSPKSKAMPVANADAHHRDQHSHSRSLDSSAHLHLQHQHDKEVKISYEQHGRRNFKPTDFDSDDFDADSWGANDFQEEVSRINREHQHGETDSAAKDASLENVDESAVVDSVSDVEKQIIDEGDVAKSAAVDEVGPPPMKVVTKSPLDVPSRTTSLSAASSVVELDSGESTDASRTLISTTAPVKTGQRIGQEASPTRKPLAISPPAHTSTPPLHRPARMNAQATGATPPTHGEEEGTSPSTLGSEAASHDEAYFHFRGPSQEDLEPLREFTPSPPTTGALDEELLKMPSYSQLFLGNLSAHSGHHKSVSNSSDSKETIEKVEKHGEGMEHNSQHHPSPTAVVDHHATSSGDQTSLPKDEDKLSTQEGAEEQQTNASADEQRTPVPASASSNLALKSDWEDEWDLADNF